MRSDPAVSFLRPARMTIVRLLAVVAIATLDSPGGARAQELPSLPLPDCSANGLPIDDVALCEGGNVGYIQGFPVTAQFKQGDVSLAISTRDVDFRNDTDRAPQFVTLTLAGPDNINDGRFISAVEREWPSYLEDDLFVEQRRAGDEEWNGDTGGKPFGPHPENPAYALLVHEGAPCKNTDTSCTYRVTWDGYPTPAVFEPLIYRVCVDWDSNYIFVDPRESGAQFCGTDPVNGCIAGGGRNCVTFQTVPPPRPKAVAKARRIGSKQFEFDASESTDPSLIEDYRWALHAPGVATFIHDETFEHDFNFDNPPKDFRGSVADLTITDHYKRMASSSVEYVFLAGVESFLELTSFEIVDVVGGIATLKAIVKNTDSTLKVTGAFLNVSRFPDAQITVTPASTELDPGESVEFTVTTAVDTTDPIFINALALGNVASGPVKSKGAFQVIGTPPGGDGDTSVTDASLAGDDHLKVGDTSPFRSGNYVGIQRGPTQEVRHVKSIATPKSAARAGAAGTLVFDSPLAFAHPVGASVEVIDAPGGDVTPPSVTVTSPLAGQSVCQGAPVTAQFSCSDGGEGIENCGGGVTNGEVLDTTAFGSRQTTVRAWDYNGNLSEKTIAWAVGFCNASIDAFHCFASKPAQGEKFAAIAGVRVAGAVDDVVVDLKKPTLLCVPADTTHDGVKDTATHLEGYALTIQKGEPKTTPQNGITLTSQLGTLEVDTAKLASLLVPTAEDPATPPAPLGNPAIDRFACYTAKLAKGQPKLAKDLQVTVADGLTDPAKRFTIQKLATLCVPVTADGGATKHPDDLLCFKAAATKAACSDLAPVNPGGACKKETDCGGTKGQTTLCTPQGKFTALANVRVANDLGSGGLAAAKDAVICLPGIRTP